MGIERATVPQLYGPETRWLLVAGIVGGSSIGSMSQRSGPAQLHLAERERERHHRKRDQHQDPERMCAVTCSPGLCPCRS